MCGDGAFEVVGLGGFSAALARLQTTSVIRLCDDLTVSFVTYLVKSCKATSDAMF